MTPRRTGPHILLCTEGTYPLAIGGVSTWCDQIIRGLAPAGYRFTVLALHARTGRVCWDRPDNICALQVVRPGERPADPEPVAARAGTVAAFGAALEEVLQGCAGLLTGSADQLAPDPAALDRGAAGLQALAQLGDHIPLWPLFTFPATLKLLGRQLRQHSPSAVTPGDVQQSATWLRDLLVPSLRLPVSVEPAPLNLGLATAAGPGALPAWLNRTLRGVPLVLVEHGVALREALLALNAAPISTTCRWLRAAFCELLTRLLYRDADQVVAVCTFNTTWEFRLGLSVHRSRVIHNGVSPGDHPALTHHSNPVPTVGWIGRIDPLKGLGTLVQAFAQVVAALPQARLRLYGPTPPGNEAYRLALRRQVEAVNLTTHVSFEGVPTSVQDALWASDVIALPSISEGLPYVLLEAMMSGRAVVAHRVGGVPEALGQTGRLVGLHDTDAFARALTELLCDPQQRADLGRQARQRALERHTVAGMLSQYQQTLSPLLSGTCP